MLAGAGAQSTPLQSSAPRPAYVAEAAYCCLLLACCCLQEAKAKGIPFVSLRDASASELLRGLVPVLQLYAGDITPQQATRAPRLPGGRGGGRGVNSRIKL